MESQHVVSKPTAIPPKHFAQSIPKEHLGNKYYGNQNYRFQNEQGQSAFIMTFDL